MRSNRLGLLFSDWGLPEHTIDEDDESEIVISIPVKEPSLERYRPGTVKPPSAPEEFRVIEADPDEPDPTKVSGGALEDVSEFWEGHKNKIMIGGGVLAAIGLWFKFRK